MTPHPRPRGLAVAGLLLAAAFAGMPAGFGQVNELEPVPGAPARPEPEPPRRNPAADRQALELAELKRARRRARNRRNAQR